MCRSRARYAAGPARPSGGCAAIAMLIGVLVSSWDKRFFPGPYEACWEQQLCFQGKS